MIRIYKQIYVLNVKDWRNERNAKIKDILTNSCDFAIIIDTLQVDHNDL